VGGGIGGTGIQLSLMPKLLLGGPTDRFVIGVGISAGLPTDGLLTKVKPEGTTAVWLNVDALGYEHAYASRLAFSVAAGVTVGVGDGKVCIPEGCSVERDYDPLRGLVLPQLRVGIGYWF
jgi:hypothetical protein